MRRFIQIVPAAFLLSAVFVGKAEAQFAGTPCANLQSLDPQTQSACRMAAHMCFIGTGFGARSNNPQNSPADAVQSCINDALNRTRNQPIPPSPTTTAISRCQDDALAANRPNEAISSCTTAIDSSAQSSPERARGLAFRAMAYTRKAVTAGDAASPALIRHATDDSYKALEIGPQVAEVWLAFGAMSAVAMGKAESPKEQEDAKLGIEMTTQAVGRNPSPPILAFALEIRGHIYRKLKEYDRAIQDYSEVIKRNPETAASCFYWRGWIEKQTGNPTAAAADLQTARRIDPNDPDMVNY